MFKRKLISLDHHNPSGFNYKDEGEYRNLIMWLEDQKIRHYKIEDRESLRAISSTSWEQSLNKYLSDLSCPVSRSERSGILDWLLGYAVRLEYGDNVEKYQNAKAPTCVGGGSSKKSANPLDNLDFNDPEFKSGVSTLSNLLQIPPHPDHLVQLKAVCLFVKERLSKEALEKLQREGIKPASCITLDEISTGFESPDYITAEAGKILRLLHIRELRELQDGANQAIVSVQGLTADPKTDTRLGKVGR